MLDEKIIEIYEEPLENEPMAEDEVRNAYKKLGEALDEYIEAIRKGAFVWGYEMGRRGVAYSDRS